MLGSAVSVCFALYYFSRTIFGYIYYYVRPLSEIDEVVRKLHKRNQSIKGSIGERDIHHEFVVFLLNQYRKSADNNMRLNERKAAYFSCTLRAIFLGVVFQMVALCPYVYITYTRTNFIANESIGILNEKQPNTHDVLWSHLTKVKNREGDSNERTRIR